MATGSLADHVRLRRVDTGATLGLWPKQFVPHGYIDLAGSDTAVVTGYEHAVTNFGPGRSPQSIVAKQPGSTLDLELRSGPVFGFDRLDADPVRWDLRRRRKLPEDEEPALPTHDAYEVATPPGRVEVRDVATHEVRFAAQSHGEPVGNHQKPAAGRRIRQRRWRIRARNP